jgi:hypothetical protein
MTRGFRRTRDGRFTVRLSTGELALLRRVVEELLGLLGEPAPETPDIEAMEQIFQTTGTEPPDDPVLARLFPDAYENDREAAGEFRRFTQYGLQEQKRQAAGTILETTEQAAGKVVLEPEQAEAWLRALNDARLALGIRLDVSEEAHEELARMDQSDPRYMGYATYSWLSFLQETLVRAMS